MESKASALGMLPLRKKTPKAKALDSNFNS